MSHPSTPECWYEAALPPVEPRPAFRGPRRAAVAIVGGGIAGLSAAAVLAARGCEVVLLEAQTFGAGASGRNGGQVLPGHACAPEVLEAAVGTETAERLLALADLAVGETHRQATAPGVDCDWQWGHLQVAIGVRAARRLERAWREIERRGQTVRHAWFEGDALYSRLASHRYAAGLLDRGAGHLQPLAYVRALAASAARVGACLHEHSPVLAIEPGRPLRLHAAGGVLEVDHVLLLANAGNARLVPALGAGLLPVGVWMGATAPLGAARARALMAERWAVADTRHILDYFRLSADHRLLFGGGVSYAWGVPRDLRADLAARIARVFPDLAPVALPFVWGGVVDVTPRRTPDFGRLSPGLWYAQGFSGHGLALAGLAGRMLALAVLGEARLLDLHAGIPRRRFPGPASLRPALLALAMSWFRLLDALG